MAHENKGDKPRLVAPGSVLLKCVDGRWIDADGLIPTGEMLAVSTTRGLQRFNGKGELPDEIPEPPDRRLTQDDADALNAKIPTKEWRDGLDGNPDPPWKLVYVAYLIDTTTATRYTFMNSTRGAQIAVERLEDRMLCMRALRGDGVRPLVKLDSRPMKIKKLGGALKQRPEFTILDDWRDLGGGGGGGLLLRGGGDGAPLIEHLKTEPAPAAPAKEEKKKTKATTVAVGRPVKPVPISEEINDGLPGDLAPPDNPLQAG
jgi:hypothetical protein